LQLCFSTNNDSSKSFPCTNGCYGVATGMTE
jgi:hypothetical protein